MRHTPISPDLFISNRRRLAASLPPRSVAVVNANDVLPTNADGTLPIQPNADLFYLSGVEQEETILLLCPDAADERLREILFIRDAIPELELWEGHKLTHPEAREISGITTIKSLTKFWLTFRQLVCDSDTIFLNTNEHKRAVDEVETRDLRFIEETKSKYPLHQYGRLAPLLGSQRLVKSDEEVAVIRHACGITKNAFERVCQFVRPGVNEAEVEAEYAHEFIRNRARFAYTPIVASGRNNCVLHYLQNDQPCKDGDLLLLDVGSAYGNYNSDLTRTIPINGTFTPRQRDVYNAVLRVMRAMIDRCVPGVLHRDWQKESENLMEQELLSLGLITEDDIRNQDPENLAVKRYFMHGLGHPIGLDVHDVGSMNEPFAPGWVLTVEPGLYIPEEGFGVRLENDVLVTESTPIDLMEDIPVEANDIEALMGGGA